MVKKLSTEKVEKIYGLTTRSIVLGIIWVIILVLLIPLTLFLSPHPDHWEWPHHLIWRGGNDYTWVCRNFWYMALVVTMYPALVNLIMPKKLKLNSWELAFICSMVMPIILLLGIPGIGMVSTMTYAGLSSPATKDYVMEYASPLFGPKDLELLSPMTTGGANVPWSAWASSIAWYMWFFLSFFSFLLFISALVRKLWVDIESLQFPWGSVTLTVIRESAADVKGEGMFKSPYLWLGFLISFILMAMTTLDQLTAGLLPPIKPVYDFTPLGLATGVFVLSLSPVAFGIGMFLSDDVLVTTFVTFILLYMILPSAVWVPLGVIEPLPPGRDNYWTFGRWIGAFEFYKATPIRGGYMVFSWGVVLGLAILPLFTNWRYFKNILKGMLWRKVPGEETEPLPYRYLWLGTFISAILFIVAMAAVNEPIQYGLVILILAALFHVGCGRLEAVTAYGAGMAHSWGVWSILPYQMVMFPLGLTENPSASVPYMLAMDTLVSTGAWGKRGLGIISPVGLSSNSYQLGYMTKTKNRDLMLSQFIPYILGTIIGLPLILWLYYTYGATPSRVAMSNFMPFYLSYRPVIEKTLQNPDWAPNASLIGNYIFGVIFVFIIYYLRSKVGKIFAYASAPAVLVATGYGNNVWLAFLLAWLIKFATRKIGGTPLLRKIAIPLGLGLLIGGAIYAPCNLFINWILESYVVV